MNNVDFLAMTGRLPENDDLDRCNCNHVGTTGHQQCGICTKCELPRFICGCVATRTLTEEHPNTPNMNTTCSACGGDGVETCDNPDHGFIIAMGREIGRLGCPCCGHDPRHKMTGPCPECDGSGFTKKLDKA